MAKNIFSRRKHPYKLVLRIFKIQRLGLGESSYVVSLLSHPGGKRQKNKWLILLLDFKTWKKLYFIQYKYSLRGIGANCRMDVQYSWLWECRVYHSLIWNPNNIVILFSRFLSDVKVQVNDDKLVVTIDNIQEAHYSG